jgi:DNA-binding MarR family transcriptional regulator
MLSIVGAPARTDQSHALAEASDVDRLRLVLLRLARRIRSQYHGESTPSQMAVLTTLARHGPSTVGQIAEHEQVQPPSASKIVSALESQDLVARHVDPEDRRCSLIALTAAGDRLIMDARLAGATWLASRLDELDSGDLAALADALPALERLLGGAE